MSVVVPDNSSRMAQGVVTHFDLSKYTLYLEVNSMGVTTSVSIFNMKKNCNLCMYKNVIYNDALTRLLEGMM